MSLKQNNLLELKESYLYVDWLHPNTEHQMIAIFRDVEKDGTWVLEQFRGPWSQMMSGYLVTALSKVQGTQQLYDEVKAAAMDIFMELNQNGLESVKEAWAGTVYDF
tara:strand:- start:58 stop:378 length:321 start_codon:yes stop_codon:yes gene_type:complete